MSGADLTGAGAVVASLSLLLVVGGRAVIADVRMRAAVLVAAVATIDLVRVVTPSSPPMGPDEYVSLVAMAVGAAAAWSLRPCFFPNGAGSPARAWAMGAAASTLALLVTGALGGVAFGVGTAVGFVVHTAWVASLGGLALALVRDAWRQPARSLRARQLLVAAGLALLGASILPRVASWLLDAPTLRLVGYWLSALGVVAFSAGVSPPGWLRVLLGRSRQTSLRRAQRDLIQYATTVEQVAERGLRHAARIVGARDAVALDDRGQVLAHVGERLVEILGDPDARVPDVGSSTAFVEVASLRVLVVPLGPSAPGCRLLLEVGALTPTLGDIEVQEVSVHAHALGVALERLRRTSSERRERDAQRRLLKGVELAGQGVLRLEDHRITHVTPWVGEVEVPWLAALCRFGAQHARDETEAPPLVGHILQGTPTAVETRLLVPGDGARHLRLTASIEGPGTATLVIRDVTEAVAAKQELEERGRLLADAEAVAHLGSWSWDPASGEVVWSEELYRIFGLDPTHHVPTFAAYLAALHPDDRDAAEAMVRRALGTGRPWTARYRVRRADGEVRWLESRGRVAPGGDDGGPGRLEGTCRDVTEEHLRLQVLEDQHARLQALSHRVVEVQERERREIADHLHDALGQVITAIDLRVAGYQESGDRDLLAKARVELRSLLEGVRDLARYLRPPPLDDVGLPAALETLVDSVRRLYDVDLVLHLDIDGTLGLDPAGRLCAYRVVQESLTNACRHAPGAPITVRVTERPEGLVVWVADDGPGFDLEAVPRDLTGLSAMSERAALAGGWLDVITEPGSGTLVRLEVPRPLEIDLRTPDGVAVPSERGAS